MYISLLFCRKKYMLFATGDKARLLVKFMTEYKRYSKQAFCAYVFYDIGEYEAFGGLCLRGEFCLSVRR